MICTHRKLEVEKACGADVRETESNTKAQLQEKDNASLQVKN